MTTKQKRNYLRNDIILIASVIILCIVAMLFFNTTKEEGGKAVVVIDGKEVASYSLDEPKEIRLENKGGYNILVIEDGYAFIKDASCHDKICVNHNKKKYNGETIVCLPNKITVKIVSDNEAETDF